MKKRILVIAVVAIVFSTIAYGTLAYFTSTGEAVNEITSGNIKLKLYSGEEKTTNESSKPIVANNVTVENIVPAKVIGHEVYVENAGNHPLYARVKVDLKITPAQGVEVKPDIKAIELDINEEFWTYSKEDGYYYYKQILKDKSADDEVKKSEPLFKTITFKPDSGNEYMNAVVRLNIIAEAVQSQNNPIPEDGSITDVKGWPQAPNEE